MPAPRTQDARGPFRWLAAVAAGMCFGLAGACLETADGGGPAAAGVCGSVGLMMAVVAATGTWPPGQQP